jgi:hypothetical protein
MTETKRAGVLTMKGKPTLVIRDANGKHTPIGTRPEAAIEEGASLPLPSS